MIAGFFPRWCRRPWPLLLGLCFTVPCWAVDELALKAAVAYKLMLFAEWPASALAPGAPLKVCTGAGSPYAEALRGLRGQRVGDHPLELQEVPPDGSPRTCHTLVLDSTDHAAELLQLTEGQATLVIADELPVLTGVAVRMALHDGRVGFEVYLSPLRRRGLRLSAQLLRLARAVHE